MIEGATSDSSVCPGALALSAAQTQRCPLRPSIQPKAAYKHSARVEQGRTLSGRRGVVRSALSKTPRWAHQSVHAFCAAQQQHGDNRAQAATRAPRAIEKCTWQCCRRYPVRSSSQTVGFRDKRQQTPTVPLQPPPRSAVSRAPCSIRRCARSTWSAFAALSPSRYTTRVGWATGPGALRSPHAAHAALRATVV